MEGELITIGRGSFLIVDDSIAVTVAIAVVTPSTSLLAVVIVNPRSCR